MTFILGVADQLGQVSWRSLAGVLGLALGSLLALAVVGNVLHQLLSRNPHEPPVVFHWLPVIGSTIEYGMDPYKFFFKQRRKVRHPPARFRGCPFSGLIAKGGETVRRYLHLHPARQEGHRLPGHQGQRLHPQRQAQGSLRRGGLHAPVHARLRPRRRLRLPQLEVDGAEEGPHTTSHTDTGF